MRSVGVRGAVRSGFVAAVCGVLLMSLSACGGPEGDVHRTKSGGPGSSGGRASAPAAGSGSGGGRGSASVDGPSRVPGIGDWLHGQIPADSRQVVAVYGDDEDSPDSTIVLYAKRGTIWSEAGRWRGHNGRKGWTTDHHEDDLRSPVGVFTLSDAGGVLEDPGTRLPYDQSEAYEVPEAWGEAHRRDFYYVIAVDYNRVRGTPPVDPTRPEGQTKGGSIWMHLDHGDGTLACISLPEAGIRHLLRTLDPERDPVVVMGDREALKT
ncbi:hypothetical protein [Streptomyces sp. NPDC001020]